jgi:protein-arginine kinase activator protein McsA
MNTQAGKRPREKILKPGLCDSCSSTMSAVWRKNKTQCNSCYGKSYKEAHKKEIAIRAQARYQAHKEERAAKDQAYYQAHKEEIAAKEKAYREVCEEERQAIETLTQLSSSQNIDEDHT